MEKINKSIKNTFLMPKLFLEDIQEIISILEQISSKKAKISTDEYSYENFEEFMRLKTMDRLKNISIQIFDPYTSISIGETIASIYTDSDGPNSLFVQSRISDIFKRTERMNLAVIYFYENILRHILNGALVANTVFAVFFLIIKPHSTVTIILWITAWVLILIDFVTGKIRKNHAGSIYLTKKKNNPNYWTRNKDRITVGILIAIVSTLIGYFLGKL